MFIIEHLDGQRLSADQLGFKVVDMPLSSLEMAVVSEQPTMRPGRVVYGLTHGLRTCRLIFTIDFKSNLAYERLVHYINGHFMRDEPYYLYRDFRSKAERSVGLPDKRLLVIGKSVTVERLGAYKAKVEVECESYKLPYLEDTGLQTRTWTSHSHQLTLAAGSVGLDPRYCEMVAEVRVTEKGDHAKILFNGKPYFWYKKAVAVGDVFVVDGVTVTKNGVNCFEDCYKQTAGLKAGQNRIQLQGAELSVTFNYRQLYL